MKVIFRSTLMLVFLCYFHSGYADEATVEVLHSWKDAGDLSALNNLKADLKREGIGWQNTKAYEKEDFDTLNSRVFNGDAPAAVEINDLDYKQWARLRFLANMNHVAATENWNQIIPKEIAEVSMYDNKYVSVPVGIHRTNWFWSNKQLLARFNLKTPKTWKDFDLTAEYLLKRGYPVLSIVRGHKSRAMLFESIVLSIGGPDLYRSVFISHDIYAYKTKEFKASIARFYKLLDFAERSKSMNKEGYFDFLVGDSAFVFDGDWLSKSMGSDGKEFSDHYKCNNMPGIRNQFIFEADSFVFFNLPNIRAKVEAQTALAIRLMSVNFQQEINRHRGSIPVRNDLSLRGFDSCAQKAYNDITLSSRSGTLVPSAVNGMATSASVTHNFIEEINNLAEAPLPIDASAQIISRKIRLGNYLLSK